MFPVEKIQNLSTDRSRELVTAQVRSNTDFPNREPSEFVDRPVTDSVTGR